ncbi:MAG TPA: pseudouridine synthase [Candidatus Gracilibacteria bacterium]|mgnify:CR=1 FL=1|nr:pseudouridine synthase [Candidatus Gracilibacteria bacterium]
MEKIRLQKYLAGLGLASRRKCEEIILSGIVKVNSTVVTELGTKVDPDQDIIEVDEQNLKKEKLVYYALNKPVGWVSSAVRTKIERNIVTDLVPKHPRVFPIGRLDKDSSGLLILTNDGTLTYKLTHPSQEHQKEYEVQVSPAISEGALQKLTTGLTLFGEKTSPTWIRRLAPDRFRIILQEGKNRHIRRICRKVGVEVIALHRMRIGSFILADIPNAKYRQLKAYEVDLLLKNPPLPALRYLPK